MVIYERPRETAEALASVADALPTDSRLVVLDNGSTSDQSRAHSIAHRLGYLEVFSRNLGCPQALNWALSALRESGENFIKVDPDVVLHPNSLIELLRAQEAVEDAAIVAAFYPGGTDHGRLVKKRSTHSGTLSEVTSANARTMLFSGEWLDRVGYFDVLHPDQRWGYEDLLMCERARAAGYRVYVLESARVTKLATSSKYGEHDREAAHKLLDPLYFRRVEYYRKTGCIQTGMDGRPLRRSVRDAPA